MSLQENHPLGKCKIAVFHEEGKPLEMRMVDIPKLKDCEVLVRNEYTTLCRSDLKTYTGQRKERTPTILGHEIVGRIVAFGPNCSRKDLAGRDLKENDRISWAIFASNPDGPMAKAGIPQKAKDLFKYGHEKITEDQNLHGGLAEYTILRVYTPILKISENIPLSVAALINCAIATVSGAIRVAGIIKDRRILVSGTGMLGIVACAMCKALSAKKIIALDPNLERLKLALEFGADAWIQVNLVGESIQQFPPEAEAVEKVDVVLEFSGVPVAMEKSLTKLDIGGTSVWVGAAFPQRDLRINAEKVLRGIWTIKGLHNYNRVDFLKAVEFIEAHHHQFPFATLVEEGFNLDSVEEAFKNGVEENPFRVGINL